MGCVLAQPLWAETVYLSALDVGKISQGWGSPQRDLAVTRKPLAIAGQKFEKGLGTHSPMSLWVKVNGATRFRAQVGVDDNNGTNAAASVSFKLAGDGRTLFESRVLRSGDPAVAVDVDLRGVRLVLFTISDAGDGFNYDHADWAEARFEYDGTRPEAVSPMEFGPANLAHAGVGVKEARPVKLPFEITLPEPITNYTVVTASGEFHREYLLQAQPLNGSGFEFTQKAGRSGSGLRPWILVRSTESGKGYAGLLGYSGNWSISVRADGGKSLLRLDSVPSGLKPFKTIGGLALPGALVAEFSGEWDNGTLPIARFLRSKVIKPQGANWPLVQWNTWYDDLGYPTEKSVLEGARVAAELGCEMVVLDAGWYGGKGHWENLCGDWHPNQERFPNGLEPAIKAVRNLGMKFGLWTEIESASSESPVGKAHPDWLLREGDRLVSGRSVLDYGKPEVVAWAKSEIDRLMKSYQLDYIKNDFNTDLPVNSADPRYAAGDPLYAHYRGLDEFWTYVRTTYPNLVIENCSSGSLRHEALTASQSGTHWVSDEVGNNYNLAAVFGATFIFPPESCLHWTCYPENKEGLAMDLEAQFTASMMGHMGFSSKIYKWDEPTRKVCARQVALYKEIRPILRQADVYHLTPQASVSSPNAVEAALYVAPGNRAVLFAFQGGAESLKTNLKLRGLDAGRRYQLRLPEKFGPDRGALTGAELMERGLELTFPEKGASAVIRIGP